MDSTIINLLNGITYAFILFLLASGLSLVFGVMGIVNMAHGAIYMFGAYLGLAAVGRFGSFPLAILSAVIGAALIGLFLERVFLNRLYKKLNEQTLLTLGIVYIASNAALWIWGSVPKIGRVPSFISGSFNVGQYLFSYYRLDLIGVGLAVFFFLWWLQDKTRVGARVRAGMDDKEMTIGLGINYAVIASAVFIVGAAMGGLAGYLAAPLLGVNTAISMDIFLYSMIVIVVGGIGNIQGALLGSLIIGLFDTFGKVFFPDFAVFTVYLIFTIMLLVRPMGLLGRQKK